jgi:hypothetical protein
MGVCMVDVNNHVPDPSRFVGARRGAELLEKARVEVVKGREHQTKPARHKLHIEYATEAEEVPNTAYYRERIRAGELFAADAQTASVSGLKAFVPVSEAEAAARASALEHFDYPANIGGEAPPQFFAAPARASKRDTQPTAEKGST